MLVSYADTKNWSSALYGQNIVLTNGITVDVQDDTGVLYSLTDANKPILSNGEWGGYCHDFSLHAFGIGDDWASVRWTFSKSGKPITLRGEYNERLVVTLNDDFTGLSVHHFLVQGKQVI
jgi:hypothetical protein